MKEKEKWKRKNY